MAQRRSSSADDSKTKPYIRPIHKKAAAARENPKPMHVKGWIRSLSSHSASFIAVTVTFPFEVIKTRMQIQVSFKKALLCLLSIQSNNLFHVRTGTNGTEKQVRIQQFMENRIVRGHAWSLPWLQCNCILYPNKPIYIFPNLRII